MSVQITVICDFCEAQFAHTDANANTARSAVRNAGWRQRRTTGRWLDICSNCQDHEANAEIDAALKESVEA